jgi:agmatine deiminase
MAWAVLHDWDQATAGRIKRDLGKVVRTIARFEPVRVLAPRGAGCREARREFAGCGNVTVIAARVDDFWMRDIMPTFALRGEGAARRVVAIDWNFNGWGGTEERRRRDGDDLAKTAASIFGVPRIAASFVAEGGALVFDGRGTLIATRSCLLNPNRNRVRRGVDRQRAIARDVQRFGIRKAIWLEGDPCEPITSGHTDGYVLTAPGGVVLVETTDDTDCEPPLWREHDVALLEAARDPDGRKFKVVRVKSARRRYWKYKSETFAASYLNAYVANGAVIGAKFGDAERDEVARKALARAFPGRETVMLRIDAIANAGGGVHCVTQGMPVCVGEGHGPT